MAGAATGGAARVPVRVADCFLLALDAFMQRTGQGAQVSQSVMELDDLPDLAQLRGACQRLVEKHPLLCGRLRRNWRTWLPYWEIPARGCESLPLHLWSESASAGRFGPDAESVAAVDECLQSLGNTGLPPGCHAALDLIECRDGRCVVVLSWRHLLIDGKGAELLFAEIAHLCAGIDLPGDPPERVAAPTGIRELVRKTKPVIRRFTALQAIRFSSLGGRKPRRGRLRHRLVTFDEADSMRIRRRAGEVSGGLFPMAFYVAAAARAHDVVLAARNTQVDGFFVSVPVQVRKRGARGPLFHNHVFVLFFGAHREVLGSMETAASAMKQQFAEMTRASLHESFAAVLELMMRLPAWLFMTVVRFQFRGEISSFFHSHTGAFAPELTHFAGVRIANAYHLPCLGSPPGSGIFLNEFGDRLNLVFAWRDGAISPAERTLMVEQTLADLTGRTAQTECHAL